MNEQQYVMPIPDQGGVVTVEPVLATLQAAYGAVTPLSRPEDFERISEIAQEEQALRAV